MPNIVALVLAAGHSRRFGGAHKLLADLAGRPIISHVVDTLSSLTLTAKVIVSTPVIDASLVKGWDVVELKTSHSLQSDSLKAGLEAALSYRPDALLLCLGDMPLVPNVHFQALIDRHEGRGDLVATTVFGRSMPPALFGKDWFGPLSEVEGDMGARPLVRTAPKTVPLADDLALDVDTLSDLERLRRALS